MQIKTNLSTYEPPEFDQVSAGVYAAQIVSASPETASTGNLYLNVEFEITGPTEVGRHVWANFYLTEKARWKIAMLVSAVGLPQEDQLETDHLIGKKLRIVVKDSDSSFGTNSEAVHFRRLVTETVPF